MADENNVNKAFDVFSEFIDKIKQLQNATIFDIADMQRKFEKAIKDFPADEVEELQKLFAQETAELGDSLNKIKDLNDARIKAEREYQDKVEELNNIINTINNNLDDANESDTELLNQKKKQAEDELKELNDLHKAQIEGKEYQYKLDKELEEKHQKEKDEQLQANKALTKKIIEFSGSVISEYNKYFLDIFKSSVNSIATQYEQEAGKLSAALTSSVEDIGNLQRKIATELRDTSLSAVISNIKVMAEASSLVSSGYTNTEKLQESATGIAVGRDLAPGLNFDTNSVKALTNVFGNDFISKFSAIQAAVQETAGSTINISSNLTKMMSDLEPVYMNAEYQNNALKDTSDIEATLSAAQDAGIINASQADEYMNMIIELMDPSKAFKSSSTTVKAAATTYDFGSGSPLQALEALLGARQQMYGGLDMSSSYMGNITRSLAAGAFGDNTMNATYMQSGLYGLDVLSTNDLDKVYSEQLSKYQSGDYTTQKSKEENTIVNSAIASGLAKMQEWFPATYAVFSASLFAQLQSMPNRIARAISNKLTGNMTATDGGGVADVTSGFSNFFLNNSSGGTVGGKLGNTSGLGSILNSGFATKSLIGLGAQGSRAAMLTSGATMAGVGLGIAGILNTAGQWDSDRSLTQNLGHGGDMVSASLSGAGIGAGVGAIAGSFIPVIGNVLGGLIGAGVGAIGGLVAASAAQKEAAEANTAALEAQTAATKELLGDGVSAISALDAKREIAKGGGVAHLKSGDYAIDYTPSGYASGLDYVPFDEMIVKVHKGESIVTAEAAEKLRKANPNFWNTPMSENSSIVDALREQTDSIVSAVSGDVRYTPLTKASPKQYVIKNTN